MIISSLNSLGQSSSNWGSCAYSLTAANSQILETLSLSLIHSIPRSLLEGPLRSPKSQNICLIFHIFICSAPESSDPLIPHLGPGSYVINHLI